MIYTELIIRRDAGQTHFTFTLTLNDGTETVILHHYADSPMHVTRWETGNGHIILGWMVESPRRRDPIYLINDIVEIRQTLPGQLSSQVGAVGVSQLWQDRDISVQTNLENTVEVVVQEL